MRIALINWSNRRIGGTGTYLSAVVPHLLEAGHEVALWHEVDRPADYDLIPLPDGAPSWSVENAGLQGALDKLASWRPDILYTHGLLDPSVERKTLDIAPAVFFAHDYYGTCISGAKTFTRPVVQPCDRRFGWPCLAQYYPKRCGGLSPVTMMTQFRRQKDRLALLSKYSAIVTHSSHMQDEYIKHGLEVTRVFRVKYGADVPLDDAGCGRPPRDANTPWHLLFVGRMDRLKGGAELLSSLSHVIQALNVSVRLTFAGDGPHRQPWASLAADLMRQEPRLVVDFPGWLDRIALDALYGQADLLVLPSLWPEPLSLVGLEAGHHGVPTVAFDVGGISDWLKSGTNGLLAPGDPPTVQGLADAIIAVLSDPRAHRRLGAGAKRLSGEFSFGEHLQLLQQVFDMVMQ